MRIRINTTTVIDVATGEAKSKSTWQVEGDETGLGNSLAQVAACLQRKTGGGEDVGVMPDPVASDSRPHPAAAEARVLAGLLEIREDVEQALTTRPAGRVLEVLKWIRSRRGTTAIRSVPSLFWSLVARD